MDLIETFAIFLAGYAVRDMVSVNCIAGALTRIEQKLGTGEYERRPEPMPEDPAAPFRRAEGGE